MKENYRGLLRKYSGYIRRAGKVEAASIALRMRSIALRDVIAFVATRDSLTAAQLRDRLLSKTQPKMDFRYDWLATLGRVCALQAYQRQDPRQAESDTKFGLVCLEVANRCIPKDNQHKQFHRLEVELLIKYGRLREAAQLITENPFLEGHYFGYLKADIFNPTISRTNATYFQWSEGFNRPFRENGLTELHCSPDKAAFNNVRTLPLKTVSGGPRVSVVMTTYNPQPEDFLQAVRSILAQSWKNLELIIVDDASPTEFSSILHMVSELDSRVRLVRLSENGGTYRARNVGLEMATGEFITGQDSDDWSHPQRIATQVEYLTSNPAATGVLVEAIRVDEHLVRAFPGQLPNRVCEVSLMLRAALAHRIGGYIDARKGADSEFRFRLEAYTGREVDAIQKPLYLTRIGHQSLSNADFKPGWSHPVRRAFWNASRYWHRHTDRVSLRRATDEWEPLPVPNRFKVVRPKRSPHFDVVFVCDWRAYRGRQRALFDAIGVHRRAGHAVGIMHLESVLSPSAEKTRLSDEIQALINGREVSEVVPDENATTDLVVIKDPVILQFSPTEGIALESKVAVVSPDMPPCAGGLTEPLYDPLLCTEVANEIFQSEVLWSSEDPAIHRLLVSYSDVISVSPSPLPRVFNPDHWENGRPQLRGGQPIVGRHAENYEESWPDALTTVEKIWPSDGSADVWILGDTRALRRKDSRSSATQDWLVFRDDEIRPESFMSGIDFFVYFPQSNFEQEFCREAVEAAAAGAVVILPTKFTETHGNSAIYAEPGEVAGILSRFRENRSCFLAQIAQQRKSLAQFSDSQLYLDFTQDLTDGDKDMMLSIRENHASN